MTAAHGEPKTSRVRALVLVLAAACGTREPAAPECTAVAAQLYTFAHAALATAKLDDALRRQAEGQLAQVRDAVATECRDRRWSAGVRECIMRAQDRAMFEACTAQLTDDQRAALDRASREPPPSPRTW